MIRPLTLADAPTLQSLNATVLGYDLPLDKTAERLASLLGKVNHILLGVTNANQDLVGYVHASVYDCLYFPSLVNVMALAVAEKEQGQGYGRLLMTALEDWAREQGYAGIRVNSGIDRRQAHAFYERLGYLTRPDQKRFFKVLS